MRTKECRNKYLSLVSNSIILILLCLTNNWFMEMLSENPLIPILIFLNLIWILLVYLKFKTVSLKIMLVLILPLLFLYFKSSNIKYTYSYTPSEIDQQIQRMNSYPPSHAKLGYILETKKEIKYLERFMENLIKTVDFNTYFPDHFSFITLPFFLLGIFKFFSKVDDRSMRKVITIFLITLVIIGISGINGKYGPFLVFPFLFLFIYIGIYISFEVIKSHIYKIFRNYCTNQKV